MSYFLYFEAFCQHRPTYTIVDVALLAVLPGHVVERKEFLFAGSFDDYGVILCGRYGDAAAGINIGITQNRLEAYDDFDAGVVLLLGHVR